MSTQDTTIRGFAIVEGHDDGPVAVWHVAYGGRLAANVNAVVIAADDPEREDKLDSLLWRQFVLHLRPAVGRPSVQDVCRLLIDEARQLRSFPELPPPLGPREPRSDSLQHHVLAAADDLVASWNFWLKTVRKVTPPGVPTPPVLPSAVLDLVAEGPVTLVGGVV